MLWYVWTFRKFATGQRPRQFIYVSSSRSLWILFKALIFLLMKKTEACLASKISEYFHFKKSGYLLWQYLHVYCQFLGRTVTRKFFWSRKWIQLIFHNHLKDILRHKSTELISVCDTMYSKMAHPHWIYRVRIYHSSSPFCLSWICGFCLLKMNSWASPTEMRRTSSFPDNIWR